jgi:hypothetical protein
MWGKPDQDIRATGKHRPGINVEPGLGGHRAQKIADSLLAGA